MYSIRLFKKNEVACLALVDSQPFGLITICCNSVIYQAFLPFYYDSQQTALFGHLAKSNEVITNLSNADDLKITFQGEHAYISPNWYVSKEQVPTWNYQSVQIGGKATLLNNSETLQVITELSNRHESQFEEPWTMEKLPQKKTDAMLNAIVGFRVDIQEIKGINKMSQNKTQVDRDSLVSGLRQQSDPASQSIAELIIGAANE